MGFDFDLCASKCPPDPLQPGCRDFVLSPLVALAYVDRTMECRVLDIFVNVPLVRRVFVLVLLFAGGVVGFALARARDVDGLLFARGMREVRGWTMPRGYR